LVSLNLHSSELLIVFLMQCYPAKIARVSMNHHTVIFTTEEERKNKLQADSAAILILRLCCYL